MEVARQDTDDGDILLVGTELFADDVGVTAVAALPEAVAENDDGGTIDDGLLGEEVAAEDGAHAEGGEEIGGDKADGDLLGALVTFRIAEVYGGAASTGCGGELLEETAALLIIVEIGRRDSGEGLAAGTVIVPDSCEAVGLQVGERAQQDSVDYGEHGGVGADAESECGDGDEGETGSLGEEAKSVANVVEQGVHGGLGVQ